MRERMTPLHAIRPFALAALALLSSCGGGGGGSAVAQTLPAVDVSAVAAADPGTRVPADWKNGVFIEIYVRGYKDSNGDGIGDLRGLTASLDYLRSLGITGIWLMPVMQSQDRDHGYAVADYRAIEKDYGTLADFDDFLAQAHARGIGVIIDYVMNHSAADNPLFENASASAGNPYRDWYVWEPRAPGGWSIYGKNPWYPLNNGAYFAGFWDQMPDFNLRNEKVVAYHQDNMRFWLNRGVDGLRFDAVGNLIENGPGAWENQPENPVLMGRMKQVLAGYANRYMVCESPAAPRLYGGDDACGASFAFDHRADIVGAAQADEASIADLSQYFLTAPKGMATLVSNHDAFAGDRLWDQVNGNLAEYRLAAATYLLEPGTPFRVLSANVANNNVAAQAADPNSLLSFYKAVIALRKSRASLMKGGYEAPSAVGRTLSFRRALGGETTLVVFNYDRKDVTVAIAGLPAGASLQRLWPQGSADASADAAGAAAIALPRQTFAVFAVAAS